MNLRTFGDPADLRRAAEIQVKEGPTTGGPLTEADLLRLKHELQVHQIELEMQNQELCVARADTEASLKRYTELFECAPVCYLNLACDGMVLDVNLAGISLLGIDREQLVGSNFGLLLAKNDRIAFADDLARNFVTGAKIVTELTIQSGDRTALFVRLEATLSNDRKQSLVMLVNLTERRRIEEHMRGTERALKSAESDLLRQQRILERIAEAAPLNEILHDLVIIIEDKLPSVSGSFLLLDPDGVHLRVATGGKLPKSYNDAIEGMSIGPKAGSCGTAVFRGENVFVSDIASDPLWVNFRDLALSNGLCACWSIPIRSRKNGGTRVLGTFAVYSNEVGLPDERLNHLISRVEYLACIAIESSQTAENLQASEARFRTFVENTPDAFLLHQSDGTIIDVNDQACKHLGYSREELIGMKPDAFVLPFSSTRHQSLLNSLTRGEQPIFETLHRSKNGAVIPVEVRLSSFRASGEFLILASVRDISARKHVEQQLQAKNELLEQSQLLAHLGSFEWSLQTNELTWSDELYRIYGYSPQEIKISVETFLRHIYPDDVPFVKSTIDLACANASSFSMEERIVRRDGTIRNLLSRGSVVCDDMGRPARIIGACMDVTDHKKAEAERNASQLFVKSVAEASPFSILVFDLKQRTIVYSKSRVLEELGYECSDSDLLAWEKMVSLLHPDDLARFSSLLTQWEALADGQVLDSEFRLKDAHGAWHWFASRDTPFTRTDDGRVSQVIGTMHEITGRKRSEAALRESEERYRLLFESIPLAIFTNVNDRVEFCNNSCLELFAATDSDQILGRSVFELIHPDYHQIARRRIAEILNSQSPSPIVRRKIVRLDGREVPVNLRAIPFTDRGARGILVCMHDLTEQERSIELLHSISESVADAIVTCDESGVIVTANSATSRMFGYSLDEIIGNTIGIFMPDAFRGEHATYLPNYIRTGIAKVVGIVRELQGCCKDATEFPIELTVTEFPLNGKRHFTGVMRDTTERKRLEHQFHQAQKMEAVGRLAGGVAHDFNNLLTIIMGYGETILDSASVDAPRRAAITAILDAAERAGRLTQQLLAFSRTTAVEMKTVDLNSFVEKTVHMLRRLIEEDIVVTLKLSPKLARIQAPPGQLEQLIMNLAVNARDAMPCGGQLSIETRIFTLETADLPTYADLTPGHYVELSVTDTGHGMSDEIKNKIFDPFFTTKEVGKGTGLGLSVVHGVVKKCCGSISVESTVGIGTTFRILFPAQTESVVSPNPGAAPVSSQGHETILLVEDELAVRTLMKATLEAHGYKVLEAVGGQDSILIEANFPGTIDLLLTDVVMPEISGQKVAEAIKRLRPAIRVIYMSGYANEVVFSRGVIEATDDFLQKPFNSAGLANIVRSVLDRVA